MSSREIPARTFKVMLAAVKCKQNVDPALADALDAAVVEMGKMRPRISLFQNAFQGQPFPDAKPPANRYIK